MWHSGKMFYIFPKGLELKPLQLHLIKPSYLNHRWSIFLVSPKNLENINIIIIIISKNWGGFF
jgi:hypothetical protein